MKDVPLSPKHPSTASPPALPLPTSQSPTRRLTGIPRSPSYPDLSRERPPAAPLPVRTVSRSKTLPLRVSSGIQPASIPSLDGVTIDSSKLSNLRQWILGLAIVRFDIDIGPVLSSLFPPFRLYPSEAENMFVSPPP
ncbi:hypothetical protein OF83DRAFT_188257 [Amylostereum chailletii]|nr:hypothetical protein OF83DRAFT_188257 [Amylostereum chailletii]